jgi:hypothetical protein
MSSTAPWDSLTSENLLGKRKSQDISSPPSKKPKVNSDAGTSGVDEDGFGKVISRDEKRKQKKESARAAAKAVSRRAPWKNIYHDRTPIGFSFRKILLH